MTHTISPLNTIFLKEWEEIVGTVIDHKIQGDDISLVIDIGKKEMQSMEVPKDAFGNRGRKDLKVGKKISILRTDRGYRAVVDRKWRGW